MHRCGSIVAVASLCAGVLSMTADTLAADHAPGEIVIRFDEQPDEPMIALVETVIGSKVNWHVPKHPPFARHAEGVAHPLSFFRVARLDVNADVIGLTEVLSALPGIDFAATNNMPAPMLVPNDPLYNNQWSHTKMNTEAAWDIATGSTSIIVGIIDTGAVTNHEDLIDHVWINDDPINGVDDDNNGFIDDLYGWNFSSNNNNIDDVFGHGTQVSGIVGGKINNGIGVAGIANVTVMQSKWWHNSGTDFSVAESVYYAVDNGAHIVNLSLGCQCTLPSSEAAINYAHANGVLVVSSAGNAGSSSPGYPASYPNSMSISAIDINDQRPSFSNWGSLLDLGAPSPDIYSTGPGGPTNYDPDFRGTSAASPHVAGAAALIMSIDPSLTHDEVRALINDTAFDLGAPGFDTQFGHGRLDVGAAVAAIAPACVGDADGNGIIDTVDLLALLAAWGTNNPTFDIVPDGDVNTADLLAMLAAWGPC